MDRHSAIATVNRYAEEGDDYALLLQGIFTTAVCNRNHAERATDAASATYWDERAAGALDEMVAYGRFLRGYTTEGGK